MCIDDKIILLFLLLTIFVNLGMIASAKNYGVVVIISIAVDRVTKIWPTSVIIPKGYRLGVNIGGRDFKFTAPHLKTKVDVSHYYKNPKLILGCSKPCP